jgi:ribose transport system substrate-binding protein
MLNIEVVGIASAELDPIRQKNNMENFMALNPDIITCQPQDLDLAASTFDPLVKQGIKLVFLSNVPTGYKAGEHYVSGITDSLVDMGIDAADMMAEAIGGKGDIITIVVAGVNYVCNTRDGAFVERIKEKYPEINIVAEGGFQAMSEAGPQTSGLLTRYPNVKGIYVSFSNPAIDSLEAVRTLGRDDIKIVTMDLDTVACLDLAQGGNISGIIADSPYSMGFGRALLGAYGALGKPAPKYVASPAFKVTKDNLLEAWKWAFGVEAPEDLINAVK